MYEDLIARLATHFADLHTGKRDAGIGAALEFVRHDLAADASSIRLHATGERGFSRNPKWAVGPSRAGNPRAVTETLADVAERPEAFEIVRVSGRGVTVLVPLITHGELIGEMTLEWSDRAMAPDANESCKVLRVVGDLISGALEQLRADESLRRTEERLRDTQRLEALGRLSGGVAHDFNNFLTAIIGNCALLSEDLSDAPECSEDVEQIRRAAERASTLVDRILAFGRRRISRPRRIDLNWIVADMESLIRRVVGDEIHVVVDLCEESEVVVADPDQIEQVLLNLAVNARDAMPDGGTLGIRVRGCGDRVELHVRDDGCGMTEEVRAQLFEPFFTTKRAGKGTGLGLATVAGIVSELGGEVRVESTPGEGSVFRVALPRADGSADVSADVPADAEQAATSVGGSETILIVEPERVVRDLLRRVLQHDGYEVLEAADDADACAIARAHDGAIDAVVTDLAVPHMRGPALFEELSEDRPNLAAVFTSCHPEATLVEEGVLDEAAVCVEKPFGPQSLSRGVRRALDARLPAFDDVGVISSGARAARKHDVGSDRPPSGNFETTP